MSSIKNMTQLREKILQTINKLESGEIEIEEAACMAKLSETVISGLKSEMQYAILTKSQPHIPFYGQQSGITLDVEAINNLVDNLEKPKRIASDIVNNK